MSDSLLTILEMIEEELSPSMQNVIPPTQTGDDIGYIKGKKKEKEVKSGFLNVKRIVDSIISTTEADASDQDTSISESFSVIRKFNQDKITSISDAKTLNNALVSFYQNNSADLLPGCRDFSTIAKRALINAAYSKILNDFNASAAGFVNEAYLANLLGNSASTVPTNTKVQDTNFNDIADLTMGNIGISLKTKVAGVSGSLRDLMATLGIPFEIKGGRKDKCCSNVTEPTHAGGLFYVIFGKQGRMQDYFDISTILVTKDSVLSFLKKQRIVGRDGVVRASSSVISKLEKAQKFILGFSTKQYSEITTDVGGVAQFENKRLEFKLSQDFNTKQAENLGKELTTTLNTLNGYIEEVEKTIVRYAAEPTVSNLQTLQNSLQILSDFQIASLISC